MTQLKPESLTRAFFTTERPDRSQIAMERIVALLNQRGRPGLRLNEGSSGVSNWRPSTPATPSIHQ
jgi:hypothetical protein